ncbi:hypothetical protein L1987_46490 [Smallanthus sonchifolius]|uniref:Uncharacterized protein n=1 Tax=Smallanthus sonchifolius TaxID=185202 RepID=A0ACB9FZQ4_9ASTR|nr:hypothetical protein L1987_46490 [Smallanthus sonchifolius]
MSSTSTATAPPASSHLYVVLYAVEVVHLCFHAFSLFLNLIKSSGVGHTGETASSEGGASPTINLPSSAPSLFRHLLSRFKFQDHFDSVLQFCYRFLQF